MFSVVFLSGVFKQLTIKYSQTQKNVLFHIHLLIKIVILLERNTDLPSCNKSIFILYSDVPPLPLPTWYTEDKHLTLRIHLLRLLNLNVPGKME